MARGFKKSPEGKAIKEELKKAAHVLEDKSIAGYEETYDNHYVYIDNKDFEEAANHVISAGEKL